MELHQQKMHHPRTKKTKTKTNTNALPLNPLHTIQLVEQEETKNANKNKQTNQPLKVGRKTSVAIFRRQISQSGCIEKQAAVMTRLQAGRPAKE